MKLQVLVAGVALACLLSGCSQQTKDQVKNTTDAVASDVKSTTEAVASDVRDGAKDAVDATKEAAAGAESTASVKTALMASDMIESAGINVDTVDKTVFLRGNVPNEEQRNLAEEIAKNTLGPDLTVQNELSVGTAAPATPMASGTPTTEGEPVSSASPAQDHDHEDHTGHDHD